MADADTMPTNGRAHPTVADMSHVADDIRADGKRARTTLIDASLLAAVDREKERLDWPGPRTEFLEHLLRFALQACSQVTPISLDGQLSATIRPNGSKQ